MQLAGEHQAIFQCRATMMAMGKPTSPFIDHRPTHGGSIAPPTTRITPIISVVQAIRQRRLTLMVMARPTSPSTGHQQVSGTSYKALPAPLFKEHSAQAVIHRPPQISMATAKPSQAFGETRIRPFIP